jgi:predicted ATPase
MSGYRRFAEETTIDLSPAVIAIVGPNEAGKTSLLKALTHVAGGDALGKEDFSGREAPADGSSPILSAEFLLEQDDRAKLDGIANAEQIEIYRTARLADGSLIHELVPMIGRPKGDRDVVVQDLQRAAKHRLLGPGLVEPEGDSEGREEERAPLASLLGGIAGRLAGDAEELGDAVPEMEAVATRLERLGFSSPKYLGSLPERLRRQVALITMEDPREEALKILDRLCPPIHLMGSSARQLASNYEFEEHGSAPEPLANLLAIAGVGYEELKAAAAEEGGSPRLTTLKNTANANLEKAVRSSWRQGQTTEYGSLSIEIDVQGGVLHVWPYDLESGKHSRVEERSDGLRSFLALLAFTTRYSQDRKPVLLIDEAEMHLHYAAQAELVEALTSQELAAQVIYTTHSAGCLPDDLGSGVRVVEVTGPETSTTHDGFWAEREAGFTPLLLSMGASALAFTPTRAAVMAEGPSDALLLPQLFRAAAELPDQEPLGFQIAPGIAWVPEEDLSLLDLEASKVLYLLDSDDEGERHEGRLRRAGIPKERIYHLRTARARGLSVEDFVAPQTYVAAVNYLLEHMRKTDKRVRVADIKGKGIARLCETWLAGRGVAPPPKPKVAEEILRRVRRPAAAAEEPDPLLHPSRKDELAALYREIRNQLRVDEVAQKS